MPKAQKAERNDDHLFTTEHKKLDKALKESEAVMHAILDHSPAVVHMKDPEGKFIFINRHYENIFHRPKETVVGKTPYDIFPKEVADKLREHDKQVIKADRPMEFEETVPQDGVPHHYHSVKFPIHRQDGSLYGICGFSTDVTERKKETEAFKESERYNRRLFESSTIGLALCRMDGSLVDVNEAYARIIGYSVPETLKLTYWDVTPKEYAEQEQRQLESLRTTGQYGPYEKHYIHRDGHRVPVRLQGRLIEKAKEKFIWSSVEDVSDKKKAEAQLVERTAELARAHAEKEQLEVFTYLASHDLQEPLQKIIGFSELLKSHAKTTLDPKGQDYVERIQSASRRMTQLIHDLLKFSRILTKPADFEMADLNVIVKEVLSDLELLVERTGAVIEVGTLPTLRADRVHMRQLFQNLVSNALKFRDKTQAPRIEITSCALADGRLELRVRDHGIGFDPKEAERIFRPFERLHAVSEYQGSGMGLAICQKIVMRHKGDIRAISTPGEGAEFIIRFPAGDFK